MTMPPITREARHEPHAEPAAAGVRPTFFLKAAVKGATLTASMVVVALPVLMCRLEALVSARNDCFLFWGQALALAPGVIGKYLRKGFYVLTLDDCSPSCDIGFMSYFTDRRSVVGRDVYVGFGVALGRVVLGDGSLIGSRSSIINGGHQHEFGPDGRLTPFDPRSAAPVRIGPQTWLGEGAVVMADVGGRCIVGAGSVVSRPVAEGYLVAGNPCRPVRRLIDDISDQARDPHRGPSS